MTDHQWSVIVVGVILYFVGGLASAVLLDLLGRAAIRLARKLVRARQTRKAAKVADKPTTF